MSASRLVPWRLAVIAIAVILAVVLLSEGFKVWRQSFADPGEVCFEYERQNLKDPYSASLDGSKIDGVDVAAVTIKYHAKNSYGAYMPGEATCIVASGKVDEDATTLRRQTAEGEVRLKRLQLENKCIERHLQLLRDGIESGEAVRTVRQDDSCKDYRPPAAKQ